MQTITVLLKESCAVEEAILTVLPDLMGKARRS